MNDSYESDAQSAADYASSSEASDYSDYAGYGSESDTSQRQVSALKVPPHSIEAEQAVLGGLMLDNTEWDNLADVLMPEDFYRAEHQLIFAVMSTQSEANKPIDVVTLLEALSSLEQLERLAV
jgi:replicative DNA helicase